ncbi:MAG: ABC transporter permease [Rhabdochlamydiaceae bacterium]|nr:ABC transporter permease [Rhabdochlamydiaceae bacterium]
MQLSNRWEDLLSALVQHLELVSWSMAFAILFGVPLGILVTRFPSLKKWIVGGAGISQTIPSLALLGLMIPIFGLGVQTAIAALFLYSLLPIIRNTFTGILAVDKSIIDAAKGMGLTGGQILFKVEMPLALPTIIAGIRTAVVINIGTATIAAFIGAGGLGDFIFIGISRNIDVLVLIGAIPTALLAIFIDSILGFFEKKLASKG